MMGTSCKHEDSAQAQSAMEVPMTGSVLIATAAMEEKEEVAFIKKYEEEAGIKVGEDARAFLLQQEQARKRNAQQKNLALNEDSTSQVQSAQPSKGSDALRTQPAQKEVLQTKEEDVEVDPSTKKKRKRKRRSNEKRKKKSLQKIKDKCIGKGKNRQRRHCVLRSKSEVARRNRSETMTISDHTGKDVMSDGGTGSM